MSTNPVQCLGIQASAHKSQYADLSQTAEGVLKRGTLAAITPVILCRSSSTRSWPLSRKISTKHSIPLIRGKSLLHLTLERVAQANLGIVATQTVCVAAGDHPFLVTKSTMATGLDTQIVLKPIPIDEIHRLRSPGMKELKFIEVQSDYYLGKHDIVRLEDEYGRK